MILGQKLNSLNLNFIIKYTIMEIHLCIMTMKSESRAVILLTQIMQIIVVETIRVVKNVFVAVERMMKRWKRFKKRYLKTFKTEYNLEELSWKLKNKMLWTYWKLRRSKQKLCYGRRMSNSNLQLHKIPYLMMQH